MQENELTYNDDTIITFGKHNGDKLKDVPAEYLMWWYSQNSNINSSNKNYQLKLYIEDNKEVLEKELKDNPNKYNNNTRYGK